MRSILVALDATPSSEQAQSVALAQATRRKARLSAVVAIELSDVEREEMLPTADAMVAYDRLKHRDAVMAARRARFAEIAAAFAQRASAAGVAASATTLEGNVRRSMLRLLEAQDLLVIGRDTEFHLEANGELTSTVELLIAQSARPTLVTGPTAPHSGPIIVAYDGSAASGRALHIATLLGLFDGEAVQVLSTMPHGENARLATERACGLLDLYGIRAQPNAITSGEDPATVVLREVAAHGARMLVMGAYGNRGWRESLFGSCTRHLLTSSPVPLFIHH
jgi:nucleotide-binding universal stress UspA family protein